MMYNRQPFKVVKAPPKPESHHRILGIAPPNDPKWVPRYGLPLADDEVDAFLDEYDRWLETEYVDIDDARHQITVGLGIGKPPCLENK